MSRRDPPAADAPEDSVVLTAEKMVGGGRALAHAGGRTWMVAGALPGEEVSVLETRRRAGIVEADTLAVIGSRHPARDPDPCPHAGRCGGCDWPHVRPGAGARLKALAAAEAARGHPLLAGLLAEAPIHPSSLAYRLRARLHWEPATRRLGFYGLRSRKVAAIDACRILSPELMAALEPISEALASRCDQMVDVEWLQGSRPGDAVAGLRPAKGGALRIAGRWIPAAGDVGLHVAGFHGLDRNGAIRSGWGRRQVTFDLPVPLAAPLGAFFQGNMHLIGPLFDRITELAGPGREPAFDLHAGVGFLAAAILRAGDRPMHLVEPNRIAARAAAANLPSADVAVGATAESFVASSSALPKGALVITDPPRTGLSKALRRGLAGWGPRRILMLGCDPASWARDAAHLCGGDYGVRSVELFDLFPSTHHVEILALLERA